MNLEKADGTAKYANHAKAERIGSEDGLFLMSVAELKHAVDELTADERLELAEYLRWRSRKDDPEWQTELGRRLDRTLSGHDHSAAELQQLHDKLSAEGR